MSEAIEVIEFRPVVLSVGEWHLGEAAELCREWQDNWPRWARKVFDQILLMASGKSNYLNAAFRNEVLGAVAFGAPATAYFALWTTTAGTNMSAYVGNTAGEVTGGSYDRVNKTNNTTNFATISGAAAKVNSNAITFPTATADWNSAAVIPQMGVFDANTKTATDNLLIWGDHTTAKAVLNGDTAQYNTSAVSWTET